MRPVCQQEGTPSVFAQPSFTARRKRNFRGSECQGPEPISPPVNNRTTDFRQVPGIQPRFQATGPSRNTFQARIPPQGQQRTFTSGTAAKWPEMTCYRCSGLGHMSCQCPTTQDPNYTRFSCYRCGGARHMVSVCPHPTDEPAQSTERSAEK